MQTKMIIYEITNKSKPVYGLARIDYFKELLSDYRFRHIKLLFIRKQ